VFLIVSRLAESASCQFEGPAVPLFDTSAHGSRLTIGKGRGKGKGEGRASRFLIEQIDSDSSDDEPPALNGAQSNQQTVHQIRLSSGVAPICWPLLCQSL